MAYCRKRTGGVLAPSAELKDLRRCGATDQLEHPRAAAARGEAAEQAEDDDGGSGPDENVRRVGAVLRRQREIGLQTHLPPHADGQQDHACELKITERATPRVKAGWRLAQVNDHKPSATAEELLSPLRAFEPSSWLKTHRF